MKGVAISLRKVSKRYGRVEAVKSIDLEAPGGSITTLLGPSGCGKTTTLRIIAGLEKPDTGSVLFDGVDVTGLPPEKRGIGMVFQDLALFPHMTVFDNIAFGLRVRRVPETEIRSRVNNVLELVNLDPSEYGRRRISELSGGQQQRVALARVLVIEPRVLLLDEPFSHLDYKIRQKLIAEVRRLQRRLGITIVYVTHDQEEAMSISDKIVIMNNGRIIQEGRPDEVYENPANLFVATFFGEANLLEPGLAGVDASDIAVIRPERVKLEPKDPVDVIYNGVVEDVVFQGPYLRVDVRINGETIKVLYPKINGGRIRVGERVRVGWNLSDVKVLGSE
ncbi:MAG: ABC transporter ATP-binding protein [Desulfurococcales archaeon]|nr:ABC transporter ATP-binding protein [Desulfurococcales archaeon]